MRHVAVSCDVDIRHFIIKVRLNIMISKHIFIIIFYYNILIIKPQVNFNKLLEANYKQTYIIHNN